MVSSMVARSRQRTHTSVILDAVGAATAAVAARMVAAAANFISIDCWVVG
jgi:hypothetical protein